MSWVDDAQATAHAAGVSTRWTRVLDAFGAQAGSMESAPVVTGEALIERLASEVDRPQATLFANRAASLTQILAGLAPRSPVAELLATGLAGRLAEVSAAGDRRAVRVRALIDFYYSQAAMLQHVELASVTPPTLSERVSQLSWRSVRPGFRTASLCGPSAVGPLRIQLLEVDLSAGVEVRAADLRSEDGDLAAAARARGAVAAVSGGFFLYSEPDIGGACKRGDPVGLLLDQGTCHGPQWLRRASFLWRAGEAKLAPLGPVGQRLTWEGGAVVIGRDDVWTRARTPDNTDGAWTAVVGTQSLGPSRQVPLNGALVRWHAGAPPAGARVTMQLSSDAPGAPPWQAGIAGGPMLLSRTDPVLELAAEDFCGTAPPLTFSSDETFDQNLLPRMALGLTSTGHLRLAAIDGRDFTDAPGLTLGQTAELLRELGCHTAMNLDGGSSKRMVIDGVVVDRPTTTITDGQSAKPRAPRPVHSALFFRPARA